jgi:hypothetical protein
MGHGESRSEIADLEERLKEARRDFERSQRQYEELQETCEGLREELRRGLQPFDTEQAQPGTNSRFGLGAPGQNSPGRPSWG